MTGPPPQLGQVPTMKPLLVLLAAWGLAGLGAVMGSMLGNEAGRTGLFGGAVVGGLVGVGVAVLFSARLRWLPVEDRWGALVGGLAGFGVAAPIAVANLTTPVTPVLVCGLAGVGMLLGVGVGRGLRGRT